MKNKLILFLLAGLMLTGVGLANNHQPHPEAGASAHVVVRVDPNVGVSAVAPIIDAGSVQTGDFSAIVEFRVDANLQFVTFYAAASPLFKADDPLGSEVAPIPLNLSEGVVIEADNGNPVMAGSNVADFIGGATEDIDGYPGVPTEELTFESSQNNHFSQNVRLTVTWTQDDPEKPTGEYSGKVKLCCLLMVDDDDDDEDYDYP